MEINDLLIEAHVQLGIEAIGFFDSDLGHYLVCKAQKEINDLAESLIYERDQDKIKQYQGEIQARKMALSWLHEVIVMGIEARSIEESKNEE